tara:strand:+ start:252 stop:527 length:276 start_codon:yes stop_codon:yes gene_type:complete
MKFYWGKNHQMWDYCIPLGPFISDDGRKYDLGAYLDKKYNKFSFAIVYGKKDYEYISGDVFDLNHEFGGWSGGDYRTETIKRYKEYLNGHS